ncbi:MAG: hydrolase Nlp/P60, partial [Bacteroidia bacterium]
MSLLVKEKAVFLPRMQYGICLLSVVPCRKEASNTAEMVTQLLFGEHYTVDEITEGWVKIKTAFDNYECWINIKQHHRISESTFNQVQKQKPVYSSELIQVVNNTQTNSNFPVCIGSALPFFSENKVSFEGQSFRFEGAVAYGTEQRSAQDIISTAFLFLNAPYLWGGKNPFGIDCSGF